MEQRERIRKRHRIRKRLFWLTVALLVGLLCFLCLAPHGKNRETALAKSPVEITILPTPTPYMERGTQTGTEIDHSTFEDPYTKNNRDLVAFALKAWENQWGYVWGMFGDILTEDWLAYKLEQYPQDVGEHETFIRANWMGRRTVDCVGLIKAYSWYDPDTGQIPYGNGMPDHSTETLFESATEKGELSTMPEIPGLLVYREGHVGIYIGSDLVIEAKGTENGVVKTKLSQGEFTHWLKCPYIVYYDE